MSSRVPGSLGRAGLALAPLLIGGLEPRPALAQVSVGWQQPTSGVAIALDGAAALYTVSYVYALGGEMLLTRRDRDGNLVWEASFDQADPTVWERASWVTSDGAGNAIVTGTLMSGYSSPVEAASIVMKFDRGGTLLWRRVYESSFEGSSTRKCLTDAAGNVYVLGLGSGPSGLVTRVKKFAPDGSALWSWFDTDGIGAPVNFKHTPDGHLLISGRGATGSINGYAKIDLAGNKVWARGGVQSLTVGDAAGDSSGNSYLVHGEYILNGGTVIEKVDSAGTLLWERTFPLAGFRVEVGSDGRPVIAGFPDTGSAGAAFFKIDADGALLWSNPDADGPLSLLLHAHLRLDGADAAYLAASTLSEMAVCKVDSDGRSAWTQTLPGGTSAAIDIDAGGSVFVTGGTTARLDQTAPPGPGAVRNGLKLARRAAAVALSWPSSCSLEAVDYAIYEGVPGTWDAPAPAACSTGGATAIDLVPGRPSAFFQVTPLGAGKQGPTGSSAAPPVTLCAAQLDASGCR